MAFGESVYGEVPFGETGGAAAPSLTLDAALPTPTAAFTVTYTPPPVTLTLDAVLPASSTAFAVTVADPPTLVLDAVLPTPTTAFAVTYAPPVNPELTLDAVLPAPTSDFTVTYTPPPVTLTLDAVLPTPTVAFTVATSDVLLTLDAVLTLPTIRFDVSYGGPYPTDTSNAFDGLDMVCIGYVTMTRPDVTPPTASPEYDKALPYPEPVMVDGRPT